MEMAFPGFNVNLAREGHLDSIWIRILLSDLVQIALSKYKSEQTLIA